jgi:hypothetical protein
VSEGQPGPAEPRELAGRLVRQVWVEWASEQPDPKPSWLLSWEELDEAQREADMRIGDALFSRGFAAGQEAAWRWSLARCAGCGAAGVTLAYLPGAGWQGHSPGDGLCQGCASALGSPFSVISDEDRAAAGEGA